LRPNWQLPNKRQPVETHVRHVLEKLEARSRGQAAAKAHGMGLLP
jgi:DNA-binding NarL/FixJ family response regulator